MFQVDFECCKDFQNRTQKPQIIKKNKLIGLLHQNLKTALQKILIRKWKRNSQTRRKYDNKPLFSIYKEPL